MKEIKVSLGTSEGPMELHGFIPDGPSRRPAAIVLQEAFGVNPHIKRFCRRLAEEGYAVFAPELFHRAGPGVEFGYDEFAKARAVLAELTNERILDDLHATHRHISGLPNVDPGRIAAWGFCMGGWAAVLAACRLPLAAAVSFYRGGLVRPRPGIGFTPLIDQLASAGCPLLFVFGEQDGSIPPGDREAVGSRLVQLGKAHEIEVYPGAGHGFFCEDRSAYHGPTAHAAWGRASRWLAANLR